jgi:hypothetical protein
MDSSEAISQVAVVQSASLTDEVYATQVYPRLREVSLSQIAAAIAYASEIRTGRRRPHPRHWQALAELAGQRPFQSTVKLPSKINSSVRALSEVD